MHNIGAFRIACDLELAYIGKIGIYTDTGPNSDDWYFNR